MSAVPRNTRTQDFRILQRHAVHCMAVAFGFAGIPALAQLDYATPYAITTLAGNAPGNVDGTGSAAKFNSPAGVACDSLGNIYVADEFNNTIRKVTPGGMVTTIAGTAGVTGSADGPGSSSSFFLPAAVAVDKADNVYVADTVNGTIRKITPAGIVTTLAGAAGQYGSADGTGADAQFEGPSGVAVDSKGNLYVADLGNSTIREVTPLGVVTTIAGAAGQTGSMDGPGALARFGEPKGLAVDGLGNIYVGDIEANTIRKITLTVAGGVTRWLVTTLAGTAGNSGSADGLGGAAQFYSPGGLALDAGGNLYVADDGNGTIRRVSPGGMVTTLAGKAGQLGDVDGVGTAAQFESPESVAVDPFGNVLVADGFNNLIRKVTEGGLVTTVAGSVSNGSTDGVGAAALFSIPDGISVDGEGTCYVSDLGNSNIRKITPSGEVTTFAGMAGHFGSSDGIGSGARFEGPAGLALDGAGNLFVADSQNNTIRRIDPSGVVTTIAGTAGQAGAADGAGSLALFNNPLGVAVDGAGNVYVADSNNDTIRRITPDGNVSTFAGIAGQAGSADGMGSGAQFAYPQGVALDGNGNLYVADGGNSAIRRITPAGAVTTLAGTVGISNSIDGVGIAAQFSSLSGVAADGVGNVYVTDADTIRLISPAGSVTTLAGSSRQRGSVDGVGAAAQFGNPDGIAVGRNGTIYIADFTNSTVRKGTLAIASQPASQTVNSGSDAVLTVAVPGSGPYAYQWQLNGANLKDGAGISGSTGPQLFIQGTKAADEGSYVCILTAAGASVQSGQASLAVGTSSAPGYLVNLSARGLVGTGDGILIGGFYVGGTTSRTVLVQGLGPALAGEGVSGVLQRPVLTIHDSTGATVYSNTGWGSSPVLLAAAAAAYANPVLQPGSADCEALLTLPPGGYTAEISGAGGGAGIALCAIYQLP
jgi:sugar lactone lactonase YvrE